MGYQNIRKMKEAGVCPCHNFCCSTGEPIHGRTNKNHHLVTLRVLWFLKRSPSRNLFFPKSSNLQIFRFSDAYWGGCVDTRRSISDYCFIIRSLVVTWKSKNKQTSLFKKKKKNRTSKQFHVHL